MAEKIYRLVLWNFRAEWYQLSQEKRNELVAEVQQVFEESGGKMIIRCLTRWSSEDAPGFHVEEFPSLEHVQKYVQALEDKNWPRYANAKMYIGTEYKG